MYQNHVPVLREEALSHPYRFLGLGAFVLLTIRQPLRQCPFAVRDVARHGHDSKHLFGAKRAGFIYLRDHARELLGAIDKAAADDDTAAAVLALANIPCLGLVKAGFFAQCLGFDVGCIDTHNLVRFGLDYDDVCRFRKALPAATRAAKVERYLELCASLGGAETLWDEWCEYVAARQLDLFYQEAAFAVSALHVRCLQEWHN